MFLTLTSAEWTWVKKSFFHEQLAEKDEIPMSKEKLENFHDTFNVHE